MSTHIIKELGYQIGSYVYLLVDPRDNQVFYVGKGSNDRVNDHIADALAGKDECNPGKIAKINEIGAENVRQVVLRWGMTDKEALCVESAMIDFCRSGLKTGPLTNLVSGHGASSNGMLTLEELDEKFTTGDLDLDNLEDNLLCINVNKRRKEGDLYEAIRGDWNISPDEANKTDYVVAEYGGVIIGVFRTDAKGWYPVSPETGKENLRRRWTRFDGEAVDDPEIRARYIGKRIPKSSNAQNPVRYFFRK